MTQSRTFTRYGVPIALLALGVSLVIVEQNAGIAWAVVVGSLALAARAADDSVSDKRKDQRASEESRAPRATRVRWWLFAEISRQGDHPQRKFAARQGAARQGHGIGVSRRAP
jgi:hypothetical protein